MNERWEVMVEEDENGDVILPFPPELIAKYDWQTGDEIDFEIVGEGAIIRNLSAQKRLEDSGKIA